VVTRPVPVRAPSGGCRVSSRMPRLAVSSRA
jgi:hypothetical protein